MEGYRAVGGQARRGAFRGRDLESSLKWPGALDDRGLPCIASLALGPGLSTGQSAGAHGPIGRELWTMFQDSIAAGAEGVLLSQP